MSRETVELEVLVSAECMLCLAIQGLEAQVVRALRGRREPGDNRLVVFSYVIGFVVFVDVSSGTPSRLQ